MAKIDKWIRRITWASIAIFLLIFLIYVVGVIHWMFYEYVAPEDMKIVIDSRMYNYGIFYYDFFDSSIVNIIGKIATVLSICSLIILELWGAWYEKKLLDKK